MSGLAVAQFAPGTLIKAKLTTEVESANAQVGDHVSATSTEKIKQGKFSLPKDTIFNGQVVSVIHAQGGENGGSVAVLFNQAVTPKGSTVALIAGIASVDLPKPSMPSSGFGRGRRRGGYGGGGGGYPSSPPQQSSSGNAPLEIRFPADAATAGSVLSKADGDVWVNPQTKVTLQIIVPASAPNP